MLRDPAILDLLDRYVCARKRSHAWHVSVREAREAVSAVHPEVLDLGRDFDDQLAVAAISHGLGVIFDTRVADRCRAAILAEEATVEAGAPPGRSLPLASAAPGRTSAPGGQSGRP